MKINKYVWAGIAVVIVSAVYFMIKNKNGDSAMESPSSSPTPVATASPAKSSSSSVKKSGDAATSPKIYGDLIKEYDGRRIQFDINCQAIPNSLTFKNGTSIMLDNRSGDPRTIFIGQSKYPLLGYGYKIITLSSSEVPKDLLISCEGAVNIGNILLQANILRQ